MLGGLAGKIFWFLAVVIPIVTMNVVGPEEMRWRWQLLSIDIYNISMKNERHFDKDDSV